MCMGPLGKYCKGKVKVKFHTYIAPLEVRGRLICATLYITSPAGPLHPTLVWRFQEATNIPTQGGAWPVCPLMPWHYQYSFTPEWGEALSIWSKGVLNPIYLSFDSGQSQTHNLSHMSQELYHCTTKARPRLYPLLPSLEAAPHEYIGLLPWGVFWRLHSTHSKRGTLHWLQSFLWLLSP